MTTSAYTLTGSEIPPRARTLPVQLCRVRYPTTPDGRYFMVHGRLWRCSNPTLPGPERAALTRELMAARRAKGVAMRAGELAARDVARARVDVAKVALGERGRPWWTDGAPDFNRKMAAATPYAGWWASVRPSE